MLCAISSLHSAPEIQLAILENNKLIPSVYEALFPTLNFELACLAILEVLHVAVRISLSTLLLVLSLLKFHGGSPVIRRHFSSYMYMSPFQSECNQYASQRTRRASHARHARQSARHASHRPKHHDGQPSSLPF